MAEPKPAALDELLGRIRFLLRQPIDFRRTDSETTLANVRLLSAEQLRRVAHIYAWRGRRTGRCIR